MTRATHPGRFRDEFVCRSHRFSLGRDMLTDGFYLSIPVANRLVDYEEYYEISPEDFERYRTDEAAAATFADLCRKRYHDKLLIVPSGADRGT